MSSLSKSRNGDLGDIDLAPDQKMEVLCASDERYMPHAATMLYSLLEHNRISRIHYFYSAVAAHELAKLRALVTNFGADLVCYEVTPETFKELRVDKWASAAVYYRLLAPQLLPANLNKILYLDSDIIVRRSLSDLWNVDIADHALAAIPDYWQDAKSLEVLPKGEKLFNSGVLLINLQAWRERQVPERAITFIRENPEKVQFWDQEALNAILVHQWIELPVCWNAQHQTHWQGTHGSGTPRDPAIVHFINSDKPWQWANRHPFKSEYHTYRLKTPWWQYEQEGKPGLPQRLRSHIRGFVRAALPDNMRRWLRARAAHHRG